jgi:hypothetical protein
LELENNGSNVTEQAEETMETLTEECKRLLFSGEGWGGTTKHKILPHEVSGERSDED